MKIFKVVDVYQKCVNEIGDFFEYRYEDKSPKEIKQEVMKYIDNMVKGLQDIK